MKYQGFSYLEFLVYFCIFALFVPLLLRFGVVTCLRLKHKQEILDKKILLLQALDHIAEYIQSAPADIFSWKKRDITIIIWHDAQQKIDKGIYCHAHTVWYMSGIYNSMQDKWSKLHKELLAQHCSLEFYIRTKKRDHIKHIAYIMCTITHEHHEQKNCFSFYKVGKPLEGSFVEL